MQNEPFTLQHTSHFTIPLWGKLEKSIVVGMSTRQGGFSKFPYKSLNLGLHVDDYSDDVIRNRQLLARALTTPLENWVFCEQVHGNRVYKVEKKDRNSGVHSLDTAIKGVDGLYTSEKQTILATLYADCVPIYFYAPNYHTVGVAHAGWKGTVGNIAGRMIEEWVGNEEIPPSEIYTAIGPSISMDHYEVDEKVISEVEKVLSKDEPKPYITLQSGKYMLDLKQLNRQLLLNAGVPEGNIVLSTYCTSQHNDLFFSHRKENGKTGRMISFIGLR